MRLARVVGHVVLHRRLPDFPIGRLVLCEPLDRDGIRTPRQAVARKEPMGEALVVFDELGAGEGSLVALSEGREAAMPWWPEKRPVDAYCVAIVDNVHVDEAVMDRN